MESSIRLYELNEFLRRSIALNFPALLWVRCEIAELQESRGHYYLTLVEKGEDEEAIIAQSDALLWQKDYRRIRRKIGVKLNNILQEGMEIQVQVRVEFHERYGLSLVIQNLDAHYTLGKIALQRQEAVEELRRLGLLAKNKGLALPPVLQKLAVISSPVAAGYQDYLQQLAENPYGYRFSSTLFPAAMQGINTSLEIQEQLQEIARAGTPYDAVLIIRGGGAKLDLMAFDDLSLAKAVAGFPLPALVGIGHDVDETVLDLVAHQSLKTPTAAADFILHHNGLFEAQLYQLGQQIQKMAQRQIQESSIQLDQTRQLLSWHSQNRWKEEQRMVDFLENTLNPLTRQRFQQEHKQLEYLGQRLHLLGPEECLRRGYSITLHNGKSISTASAVQSGDILETRIQTGTIKSKVIEHGKK